MESLNQPITWIFGVVTGVSGFVIKHSFGTRKSLADHKLHAAETFATKAELTKSTENLTAICTRIEIKLDSQISRAAKGE